MPSFLPLRKFIAMAVLCILPFALFAQQQVTVVGRCGGMDTVIIPTIADFDLDGMDDGLEQRLITHFMPAIIHFDNESCPGPALDGSGDSNLVVHHIYPIPRQYRHTTDIDSIQTHPTAIVPAKGLTPGLLWYDPLIKVNAAILYGEDCGLLGHTADVEGFFYSLKYIGPDTLAGWMYDTIMANWQPGTIQTRSHAGTLCEKIETQTMFQSGRDTVFGSPDKHGNYLTISGCNGSFICDPGCGGVPHEQPVELVNLGEDNARLVTDLGTYYPGYAGEDPWTTVNFLDNNNGGAGPIREKMLLELSSDFIGAHSPLTNADICSLYQHCYGTAGSAIMASTCEGTGYPFFSQQLDTAGVYQHYLTTGYGCDSIITLTLSITPHDSTGTTLFICSGDSIDFNGRWLNTSGIYTDTFTNARGCDSLITLALSVLSGQVDTISQSICQGESYAGYTQAGTYTDTFSAGSCDSMRTLYLTVLPLIYQSVYDTVCEGSSLEGYTVSGIWIDTFATAGCDSIRTLHLTVLPVSGDSLVQGICQGENVNGHDSTGIYVEQYTGANGCDSTFALILTVHPLPVAPLVVLNGSELSVDTTGISGYQWYHDAILINGADSSHYTASADGAYYVEVTNAFNCSSLSDTVQVTGTGVTSTILSDIHIYPNPSTVKVTIYLGPSVQNETTTIEVFNALGEKVLDAVLMHQTEIVLDLEALSNGMYLVKVSVDGRQWVEKLMKE